MTEPPLEGALPGSVVWMLNSLEGQLRPVAERITQQVHDHLPQPDTSGDDRLRQLVFSAALNGMRLFMDRAQGRPSSAKPVHDKFRKLGHRQAARGRSKKDIDEALGLAVNVVRDELHRRAAENELSAGALNAVTESVTAFMAELGEQVAIGFQSGAEARDQDSDVARARLLEHLLTGADPDEIETQADIAGWPVPERVTVMAVRFRGDASIEHEALSASVLSRGRRSPQVAVCPSSEAQQVAAQIAGMPGRPRVAVCWPVPASDVSSAWRWAKRALALVAAKVIPVKQVIDCASYRTEIWLHAEPVLRRQLAQEMLQPLFDETPNSRDILSQTLLVWLETRESAPAIAAKLGVHPQTVRYRWKRINELFGESLHDPDFVTQMTMLLKASVPLWAGGDQSDFERAKEVTP